MAATPRNLVNLNSVHKRYASRTVLEDITFGINAGERIGVVGCNACCGSTVRSARGFRPDRQRRCVVCMLERQNLEYEQGLGVG